MDEKYKYLPNGNQKNLSTVRWSEWEIIPYNQISNLASIALQGMTIVGVQTDEKDSSNIILAVRNDIYYLIVFDDKQKQVQISIVDEFEVEI